MWDSAQRSCRRFVRGLDLPRVGSVRELLPFVEQRSGHPIRLVPSAAEIVEGVCGLWIRMSGVDFIFVHQGTSRVHQDHIIAHELAHILRNHQGLPALPGGDPDADRPTGQLAPGAVAMMLGRTSYEHADEREAELIGTYLQRHVFRPGPQPQGHDPVARTLLHGRR